MDKKLGPVLSVTAEVVCSFRAEGTAKELIQEFEDRYGSRSYVSQGSAWFVELPRFIQKLVDSGEEVRARQCLQDCFAQGISDEWWHEMVRAI